MDNGTFALPTSLIDFEVKKAARAVKTKKWCNTYKSHLNLWHGKLTTANMDIVQTIGGMLQSAYGYNIGNQILVGLSQKDLVKIKKNILEIFS